MKRCFSLIMLASLAFAKVTEQDYRFAVVGDRTGSCVGGVFADIIDEVKLLDPDFVICVGDLIHGYTEDTLAIHAQWDTLLDVVKKLPHTFHFVAGNHEIQNETDRRIYEQRTGVKRYYSFDYKNSHFIILDNTMTYWPIPQEMDQAQLDWLKEDLEKHKDSDNIFVFYHIPTYLYALEADTSDPLVETFENYGVDIVFTGHHHQYSYLERNGIEYIDVGSSGGGMGTNDFARGNFFHFLMVSVRGEEKNIAVVRKENIFARDVVTVEDLQLIDRADEEAVIIDPCIVKAESKGKIVELAVIIDNFGADSITQSLIWSFDSTRYTIKPAELALAVGPERKREYTFKLAVHNGSDIFPIPQFVLNYPFTHGKSCTLRNYLPVKRLKGVKQTKTVPVIDGKLDEQIWKKVEPITNLGTYNGLPDPPIEKTEVYLVHDRDNLYIGARCFESDFSQLKATASEHDGATYSDDNLWFFFDANLDQETYYQAIINSNGITFDRSCIFKEGESTKDLSWNGPWDIAPGREDKAWILEVKIPKKGLDPYNDEQWGFSFRRLQPRTSLGDAGYWSIPFGHYPEYFGVIEFE